MCVAGAVVVGGCAVLLSSGLALRDRQLISDVALLAGGVTGTLSCAHRAREWTGRRKHAWRLFAAAMACAALSNLWVLLFDLAGVVNPVEKITNVLFLVALLLGVAGLSSFPSVARRGTDFARMLTDGVIIGGSLITIASVTVFKSLLAKQQNNFLSQVGLLALPMLDVAMATLAILLIVRIGRRDRAALAYLSGGLVLYAISDLTRSVLSSRNTFTFGTIIDVGWIAGYVLVTLAGRSPAAGVTSELDEGRDASPAAGTILVFALLLTSAVISMSQRNPSDDFSPAATGLWLLLVLAVAVRQILLIIDNDKLRHGLERRVHERTTELRHATRRSELLLSSVGEGIYGVDQAGLITFVNPAGALTLGTRAEELIGRSAHLTFHAVQEDGSPFPIETCYVTEAIRDGTVTNAEEDVYTNSNGRSFPVEVTATPMASDDVVRGAVVVFRDVTQRQEVDRLKNEFVSMVSHELRTPLTSIRGSLGLLAGGALGSLPPTAQRMVNLALDSSARLTRLINDILDVERIESGTMPMEIGSHRADVLIDAATAQLHVLAAQVEVQLEVVRADGIVRADSDRVVQTLINLMDNAIKFSPRKSVVTVESTVGADHVEFQIRDQGRGIPPDKIDRIFSRFEQVDSSDAREKGGSGLGLAISRSLVERLGGRIWAESVEGVGATFHFTLPRADSAAGTDPPPSGPIRSAPVLQGRRVEAQPAEAGR